MKSRDCHVPANLGNEFCFSHFYSSPKHTIEKPIFSDFHLQPENKPDDAPPKSSTLKLKNGQDSQRPKKKGRKRPNLDFLFNGDEAQNGRTFEQNHRQRHQPTLPTTELQLLKPREDRKSSKNRPIFKVEYRAGQFDDYLDMNQQVGFAFLPLFSRVRGWQL